MMGVIEPERTPAPISMEQEQAVAAESEAAPREEEVIPEGTAEAEAGGVVLDQGPALTNETLRDWVKRWCGGDREGLPPISTWSTSKVKDMSYLFGVRQVWMDGRPGYDSCVLPKSAASFNDDISAWDTSSVTTMSGMFLGASSFNQPLNDWRVGNVTDMDWMFYNASAFNQPLNDWQVDNVTSMHLMFHGASAFNQPLNDWRVDNVTNMGGMFAGASAFNQPLNDWRVNDVTIVTGIFKGSALKPWQDVGDSKLRSQKPCCCPVPLMGIFYFYF